MKEKLKLLRITFYLFMSAIFGENSMSIAHPPKKIGKYSLVQKIFKEEPLKEYAVGIYRHRDERVFIKTWQGARKDCRYYELINEYHVNKFLHSKLNLIQSVVKVPQLFQAYITNNQVSLIYKYINGKDLSNYSTEKQVQVLSEVLKAYRSISDSLTDEDRQFLRKYGISFYLLSMPLFILLSAKFAFKNVFVGIKMYIGCLKGISFERGKSLELAHRDLTPGNILVNGKDIFLLDTGKTVLTLKNYDITYLSLDRRIKNIMTSFQYELRSNNILLKNYISFHLLNYYTNYDKK